jgi:hypothetical protein
MAVAYIRSEKGCTPGDSAIRNKLLSGAAAETTK